MPAPTLPVPDRPAPHFLVEHVEELDDDDLAALCEATDAAIIEGGGFGWINPPGRRALESYYRGILLVPERELHRRAHGRDHRRLGASGEAAAQQRGAGIRRAV